MMNPIVKFQLISETTSKDSTAQTITTPVEKDCIGQMRSVYEREFFQAAESGIRPDCVIETSAFNYHGERFVKVNDDLLTIYRVYKKGTDRIELYIGERVGNAK
jgi:SPP1 family predicted phage head-tail adaptor